MGDTKEYIKGDKHVHQAGSIMIKFAQYNVPERKGDWKQQEEKEAEELEKEFADFEEVVDETAENNEPKVKVKPDLPPADVFVNRVKAIVLEMAKKNGETIKTNTRAWQGEYVFFVDGKRIAKMENFFGIMKSELLYPGKYTSMDVFIKDLKEYIEYYNNERIKLRLKGMSPVQYRTQFQMSNSV